jgi:nucleoside-diphosphate-sugar epimerase
VIAALRAGKPVRTTVRSTARAAELRAAVRRGGADDAGFEVVAADLTADDGWAAAVAGCAEIHHVASPIPAVQPEDPGELIVPAREGTLWVLRAARGRCPAGRADLVVRGGRVPAQAGRGVHRGRLDRPGHPGPGDEPPRPVIRNDRARAELGWSPRDTETTIVETAESLRDLGLLKTTW